MTRNVLNASLLAIALSSLLYASVADAQRGRHRERAEQERQSTTQAAEAINDYPDATRAEPELKRTERNIRRIQGVFDNLNDDEIEKAAATLAELDGNNRLSPYEQALVDQALGQVAYERDDVAGAVARWQKAVDGNALPNRDHFALLYQIAQLQLSEEEYDAALRTLERWQNESGSRRPEALAIRGNALYRMERYDEAIAMLDQAIAAAGDNPDAALYELKMASHYEKEDYTGAAATLEQLIRRRPDEVKHQINLAQMYIELEQNDRALGILDKAANEGRLTEAGQWRQYYQLLAYADKPAEAAAAINRGLDAGILQADKDTLRALGDNLYMAEKVDEAITAYGRAAELSSDGVADQQRGHLLVERERYAEAKQALDAAIRKGGLTDEGTAYLLLGEAEQELGNKAAARAAFQKATGYERSRANAEIWLRNL